MFPVVVVVVVVFFRPMRGLSGLWLKMTTT